MSLNVIIVEDEPLSRIFLQNLLTEFCPGIHIIAKASTEDEAVMHIQALKPDIVFMDIELQQGSGFDVLKRLEGKCPHIVFTTAFDHHAIKAIKCSGVAYIHKPIDIDSLQQVIATYKLQKDSDYNQSALQHLLHTLRNNYVPAYLSIPAQEETGFMLINDIIRIEASGNDSVFVDVTGNKKVANRNIKEYESLLADHCFFRVHQSHLINLKQVNRQAVANDEFIMMNDNSPVPVSPRKKEEIKRFF